MIRTTKGLDLPLGGQPEQRLDEGAKTRSVALMGEDYPGLKPTMEVEVGDRVSKGQLLFTCKKNNGVKYTSPAAGTVASINRGAKRAFQSLVIDVDGDDAVSFDKHDASAIAGLERQAVVDQLIDSGEWTALRTRPFGKVPGPDDVPDAIFVNAMDTRPLAANPQVFLDLHQDAFRAGVDVLSRLTDGPVFVCKAPGSEIAVDTSQQIRVEEFSGPHPAGLVSTHIHFLFPVGLNRHVWHLDYQNVIAFGYLLTTGEIFTDRVVALAGPQVDRPRLIKTQVGANTDELTAGELHGDENRVIAGSALDGRTAHGTRAFLGRFHHQITVLQEGTERELLGFVLPGMNKFSLTRLFLSAFGANRYL
jgi:Na+-transporting NADH:ubiquinone oxidoreductase subunit A